MKSFSSINQTREPLSATVVIVHPETELRGIYARRLRHDFLTVEAYSTPEELLELRHVQSPDVVVIGVDSLDARAHNALRQMRLIHSRVALVTVGAALAKGQLNLLTAFGSVLHIDPKVSRVGDVASAARQAALSTKL